MSERDALHGFTDKWLAQWPEWALAEVFVPAGQRECARAWFSLRDELAHAAWGGDDPRPGEAKLVWWAEELAGWSRGARRHPLGLALQPLPAPWHELAAALPALRSSRAHPLDLDAAMAALAPYATALAEVAQRLFDASRLVPARHVAASLLAQRVLREAGEVAPHGGPEDVRQRAGKLLDRWPPVAEGTRPGRLHAALVRARLQRVATGKPLTAPAWSTLARAWQAARR